MFKLSKIIPFEDKLHDYYSVRFVESLTGNKLGKYSFFAVVSLGITLSLFAILFLTSLLLGTFVFNDSAFILFSSSKETLKTFIFMFFVFFLVGVLSKWEEEFANRKGINKRIISKTIMFGIVILLGVHFIMEGMKTTDENLSSNCLEVNCEKPDVYSKKHIQLKDIDKSTSPSSEKSDKSPNLTIKEMDEILEQNGFKERTIADTKKRMTKYYKSISLFPDSKDTDWDIFFDELEETRINRPDLIGFKIQEGLNKAAPFSVIEKIVLNGYQLNARNVSDLATDLSVDELKKLENYGVDFSLTTSDGSNALIKSLFNDKTQRAAVFNYLLENDDLVLSENVDVLQGVLKLSSMLGRSIQYSQKLIDRGARVSNETKQWIEQDLKVSNPKYYKYVKSRLKL